MINIVDKETGAVVVEGLTEREAIEWLKDAQRKLGQNPELYYKAVRADDKSL